MAQGGLAGSADSQDHRGRSSLSHQQLTHSLVGTRIEIRSKDALARNEQGSENLAALSIFSSNYVCFLSVCVHFCLFLSFSVCFCLFMSVSVRFYLIFFFFFFFCPLLSVSIRFLPFWSVPSISVLFSISLVLALLSARLEIFSVSHICRNRLEKPGIG